ncbi:hypothetical protein [Streptomyces cinereoruber]|uniref:hypothetical protein n=1 Tax=Streptomyces cinereoruber TaxID=67260 RepID=UPI0036408CB3
MNDFQPMTVLREDAHADRPWLASLVGTNDTNTITLDLSKFTAGVHYEAGTPWQPRNTLKSGIALGKITASGLYAPYSGVSSEVQSVTVTGNPTGGSFTLTYSGQTTATIPYDATALRVQDALEALSNIAPGDVVVDGQPAGPYYVRFAGALAGTDVAAMTASGSGLTGGTSPGVTIATPRAGGNTAGTDGTETFAGFLSDEVLFAPGSAKATGALLWFGEVYANQLPVSFDPADVTAVAPGVNIHYR